MLHKCTSYQALYFNKMHFYFVHRQKTLTYDLFHSNNRKIITLFYNKKIKYFSFTNNSVSNRTAFMSLTKASSSSPKRVELRNILKNNKAHSNRTGMIVQETESREPAVVATGIIFSSLTMVMVVGCR